MCNGFCPQFEILLQQFQCSGPEQNPYGLALFLTSKDVVYLAM